MRTPRVIKFNNRVKFHPVIGIFGFIFGLFLSVILSPLILPFYLISGPKKRR